MEINTEQLRLEKDALDQSLALNKIVVSLLEERKKEMRHIWMVLLTICIIFAIAISLFAYNALLEECTISQEEKELMRLHYLENKDFCYIGDQLGYSEITMKRWHKKILRKLNKVL